MARETLASVILMSMLLLVFTQGDVRTVTCNYRHFPDDSCSNYLPNCQVYELRAINIEDDTYSYSCKKCDSGFDPTEPKESKMGNLNFLPLDRLQLCRRVESRSPLYSNTMNSISFELPSCYRYTVTDLRDDETALFTCLECNDEMYYSPVQAGVRGSLSTEVTKQVCIRKEGDYECGATCRLLEYPGCEKFRILTRRFDEKLNKSLARVICLKPEAGYEAKMSLEEHPVDSPSVKDIVVPQYQSPVKDCSSRICKLIFPKCEKFYWIGDSQERVKYRCVQCSNGYEPLFIEISGLPFGDLVSEDSQLQLCTIVPENSRRLLEPEWKKEFPGCEDLTIQNIQTNKYGILFAQYICEDCADDYQLVEGVTDLPVFDRSSNKYLCRPTPTGENGTPRSCDKECRVKLPGCQEYKLRYDYDIDRSSIQVQYFCNKCDSGFEPTGKWTKVSIFDSSEQFDVCEHLPTPAPVPCGPECKDLFPECDEIDIKRDEFREDIYHCTRCAEGFYPMDYEDGARGKISDPDNMLRYTREVHLCAPDQNLIYVDKLDCRFQKTNLPSNPCNTSSCLLFIRSKNLLTKQQKVDCVKCPDGFRLKKNHSLYRNDWEYCEPFEQAAPFIE
jgi:hypothetical protein